MTGIESLTRVARRWTLPALAALATTFPASGGAQVPQPAAAPAAVGAGWLGVNIQLTRGPGQPEGAIVLSDVLPGSPAWEAGLRAGDEVVRVNDLPVSAERFRSLIGRLQPGDPIALGVRRDGGELDVAVVAGARPEPSRIVAVRLQEQLDSVHTRLVRILADEANEPAAPRVANASAYFAPTIRVEQVGRDSITTHIVLVGPSGDVTTRVVQTPDAIRREELTPLPGLVRAEVRVAPGGEPVVTNRVVVAPEREALRRARVSGERTEWRTLDEARPLAPFVTGLSRVAGAELRALNPSLGLYFGAEQGLLVTEVAEGTPAADAGLRAGDVIVQAGSRRVATLDELRMHLSSAGGRTLTVLRRGEERTLTLR